MSKGTKKTIAAVVITFIITFFLTNWLSFRYFTSQHTDFDKLGRVMKIIEYSYVDKYDPDKCEEAAINAVLWGIDDPYAVYYNEENAEDLFRSVEGYYTGIGVEVLANYDKNAIEILSVHPGGPADKAGIKSGDLIKAVDSKEYSADELAEAVSYIRGENESDAGKSISLVILRENEEKEFQVKREKLGLYPVERKVLDDVLYIRYGGFSQKSLEDFQKIIKAENMDDFRGLVIDIRSNPGGEFNSLLEMCDMFLGAEEIMYTVDKSGEKTVYKASKGKEDIPMAVLVDSSSASASEVFAGAMQSNKRAIIIGEETYGKGVTQSIIYLDERDKSKGALKITTFKNYTPDGRWINEKIIPDVKVENNKRTAELKDDEAFLAAVDYFNKEK